MQGFDIDVLLLKYRYPLIIFLSGMGLILFGFFIFKSGVILPETKVEVLSAVSETPKDITVEISGEVIKPGVYKMPLGSRIDDLLTAAGGFSAGADRSWSDKFLNRAAVLTDGQKIYISKVSEGAGLSNQQSNATSARNTGGDQSISSPFSGQKGEKVNINSAGLSELDSLPGIGQTYGQKIIEHRPYSNVSELTSKGVLKPSVYEKIKDLISVY